MKNIFFIVGLFSILFGQKDFVIPFDWAGQNGYIIHNGKLFWNQSWTSGVLLFDGTYSSYPIKFGPHTSKKFVSQKIDNMPSFSNLPDSTSNTSYFDYYRGDYSYDQLELGANFESKDEMIQIRGFKRSHGGNLGHYNYPAGGLSPIHHSYRVNYGIERGSRKYESSVARYITRSGLPDSTYNGSENDNIISTGLRFQQQMKTFTFDSYIGQFLQHRIINHTSVNDSNYNDVNRSQFIVQLTSQKNFSFGIRHDNQQINIFNFNRLVNWTTLYGYKSYGKFSFLFGSQLLMQDKSNFLIWAINYKKDFGKGSIQLLSNAFSKPIHPDFHQKNNENNFENWTNNKINGSFNLRNVTINGFFQVSQQSIKGLEDVKAQIIGLDMKYSFNNHWNIYSNIFAQLDTSYFGGGFGSIASTGLEGQFNLFNDNMSLKPHVWLNAITGRIPSFGYDAIRQSPFVNSNPDWFIKDHMLLHFELTANISGVLIHYRINNLLNAFGATNDQAWIQHNHIYQKLGRMIQFGVTWNFIN